jgi:hypothetical protein
MATLPAHQKNPAWNLALEQSGGLQPSGEQVDAVVRQFKGLPEPTGKPPRVMLFLEPRKAALQVWRNFKGVERAEFLTELYRRSTEEERSEWRRIVRALDREAKGKRVGPTPKRKEK